MRLNYSKEWWLRMIDKVEGAALPAPTGELMELAEAVVDECVKRYAAISFRDFDADLVPMLKQAFTAALTRQSQEIAALRAALDKAELLAKAVGRVLTWRHNVEGVSVIREDHVDALKEPATEFYDAYNALRTAAQQPEME